MTDADVARRYDFSTPVKLPGDRAWTARFQSWEPGRSGLAFFLVSVREQSGETTTFEESIALPDNKETWEREPARGRWLLDLAIRRRLGIPSHARPLCP
ncbi:MAG: hypothetical protein Q8P41_31050 [Pseudomonadota bacterium]|nr:hypothetical protein [Pseudomonadota bacterium]